MNARETIAKIIPEAENFKPGDKVNFNGRRGLVTGTVANIRVKKSHKAVRTLQQFGIPDVGGFHTQSMVAEITPDDGRGVWTVPLFSLKMVKPGGGNALQARQVMQSVKQDYQSHIRQRTASRFDAVHQGGLSDLNPGDKVKCQFRGGDWRERKFRRVTPSGKIEVENDYGRVEKYNSQFVKKAE